MAIYDNDGTTSREIGNVYDNNGSVNSRIGKVYDNDGTTNTEIYSYEVLLFPGSDPYSGGWSANFSGPNGTSVSASVLSARATTSYTNGKVYSTQQIDVTNLSSLVFTCSNVSKTGNATLGIGINATWNTVYLPGDFNRVIQPNANGDWALNVSDKTGYWYVIMAAWGSTGNSRMDITKIQAL